MKKECTELVEPLDRFPFPLRDIFPSNDRPDINAYWDVFCQLRPAVQMQASRGCPYRCYFCLWNQVVYREGKYRTLSISRVVDEMEHIVNKYRAREIYIDDDDFTVNKKHVKGICREIQKRNLRINWSCMGNVANLDEETVYEMAAAGCIGIKFGVESASENVLKEIGKPVNLERVKNVVKWLKKYRIRSHATFTFGLLNETLDSMKKTLEFAKRLDTDSVQFSIATPYPGTKFYEILKKENMITELDWMNYDGSCRCVVNYPQLSSETIEKFYNKTFKKWLFYKLTDINWVVRQLGFLLRTFITQSKEYNIRFLKRIILKLIK
jgi:radical SAM superfamily enzyme YgiQ (UPF0313 family)